MPSVFHRISQTPDQGQQNGTLMLYLARILISYLAPKLLFNFVSNPYIAQWLMNIFKLLIIGNCILQVNKIEVDFSYLPDKFFPQIQIFILKFPQAQGTYSLIPKHCFFQKSVSLTLYSLPRQSSFSFSMVQSLLYEAKVTYIHEIKKHLSKLKVFIF